MSRPRARLGVLELEQRDVPAAVAFDTLPVLPATDPAVLANARAIVATGQTLGRQTDVFLKVGDSNTDAGPTFDNGYLRVMGLDNYDPAASGLTAYGQSILDTLFAFRTPIDGTANSFTRYDATAKPGFQIPNVLPVLSSEIAATNAGVALVMLGTNDLSVGTSAAQFRSDLTTLISTLTTSGVLPILSTIPDQTVSSARAALVQTFNQVIADVAADNHLPLWNFFHQLETLPGEGIGADGIHLNASALGAGNVTLAGLQSGQNVHNLGALQVLNWFRQQVVNAPSTSLLSGWFQLAPGSEVYAVGQGAGQQPIVSIFDLATGRELDRFLAYEPTFSGGVNVAVADVNGDGILDIITAPGSGGGPVVKVFDGATGSLLGSMMAFEPTFRTGVNVAAADLDGDGKAEVIVGAGNGGGPAIVVYHGGDLTQIERFFAYESTFRGGVNVAAANLAGFGPSIVAGSGVGGGPVVKVFRYGEVAPAASFYAYEANVRFGVQVAAGDLMGDGLAEIVTAPLSGSTHIRIFDPETGSVLSNFYGGQPLAPGGVPLAIRDGKLLVGNGAGSAESVTEYTGLGLNPVPLSPQDPTRTDGIDVG